MVLYAMETGRGCVSGRMKNNNSPECLNRKESEARILSVSSTLLAPDPIVKRNQFEGNVEFPRHKRGRLFDSFSKRRVLFLHPSPIPH